MKGTKVVFVCRECGATSPKWLGKCPDCASWNTYDEIEVKEKKGELVSILKNNHKKSSRKVFRIKNFRIHKN